MPFPIPSVRVAQASPSISLEKGSYRMRAPPSRSNSRPSRLQTAKSQALTQPHPLSDRSSLGTVAEFVPASYEKRMAVLVALLTCAMLASFATAWWLWTTSRPAHPLR